MTHRLLPALAAVTVVLAGCVPEGNAAPRTTPTAGAGATYDRAKFGGWTDEDDNGCDSRDDILARDALPGTVTYDASRCALYVEVRDPYTGVTVAGRDRIDIDHVVALHDAWDSGAAGWTREERSRFGNDPINLLASSASVNRSKGDDGPDEWRPEDPAAWCLYGTTYRDVKAAYGLVFTPAQEDAVAELVATCPVVS